MKKNGLAFVAGIVLAGIRPALAEDLSAKGFEPGRPAALETCVAFALERYEPLRIAQREVKLAALKKHEALRSLFPSVEGKWEGTTGEAAPRSGTPEFEQKLYGVEVSQPLYQGGRLFGTYGQTRANERASGYQEEKIRHDFIYEVQSAYFELVRLERHTRDAERLIGFADKALEESKKQYRLGLRRKLEYLNVSAQYNQMNHQLESARRDRALARLHLLRLLGLDADFPLTVETEIAFEDPPRDLNQSFQLAFDHRPDLKAQEEQAKVSSYAETVAASAARFKLQATGFYGRSGAAYKTEEFQYQPEWSLGLRLSRPFMGSTVASSAFRERTTPKIGQTDRTKTETATLSAKFLDSIGAYAEEEEGSIASDKADYQLKDFRRKVVSEVEEAFFDAEKAALAVQTAAKEVELGEEEIPILESARKLGEANISEVISARGRLNKARWGHTEALVNHRLALARLDKAVGMPGQFTGKK